MRGSTAGVAESIKVTHRHAFGDRGIHIIDIRWVDSHHVAHGRRTAAVEENLRCLHRSVHVVNETVPGVGFVMVDCSVPKTQDEELVWRAELACGHADGRKTEFFPIPIDWDDDEELQTG